MSTDRVRAHLLADDGTIPNSRLPLLIYPGAFPISDLDLLGAIEARLRRNGWEGGWRNGIYPYHHYHSTAHEALGVYSGEVTVQFGGDGGVVVTARPGDVVVLPAGTGHKKLASSGALGIVGAYPEGQHPDTCTPVVASARRSAEAVARVPLPACDPVFGAGGPLFEYWKA